MRSIYYYVIPAVLIFILAAYGIFQIYKGKTGTQLTFSSSPVVSPQGFTKSPIPSPAPSPVLGANTPQTQPESGFNTQEIKNVGIFVDAPQDSILITSPLKVTGRANVFEGNIQIRIIDANGNVIGNDRASACMDTDACPFEAVVAFADSSTETGTVEVYSPSAINDGQQDYKQTIPVRFR